MTSLKTALEVGSYDGVNAYSVSWIDKNIREFIEPMNLGCIRKQIMALAITRGVKKQGQKDKGNQKMNTHLLSHLKTACKIIKFGLAREPV